MAKSPTNWKNVNNWHWIEKDCTPWAHDRLKTLLLATRTVSASVSKVDSVDGEVSVNVRKGRIRQIFDLTVRLTVNIDDEERDASIVDYMSDTSYDSFEFNCAGVSSSSKEELKKAIWTSLTDFRKEVEEIQGKALLINMADSASETSEGSCERVKFNGVSNDKPSVGTYEANSIQDEVIVNAPLNEVWACLTNPARISAWTRGTSRLDSFTQGSSFSLLNGNILGTVNWMSKDNIKMNWRLKHWDPSWNSTVELSLAECDDKTVIRLNQFGVPAAEAGTVKENWYKYYWEPIKALLGCSSIIF